MSESWVELEGGMRYADRRVKIYRKVIVYSVLLITLPLLSLSTVLYFRTRRTAEEELVDSYRKIVDVYYNNLLHKSEAYDDLMEHLVTSGSLNAIVTGDGPIDPAYLAAGKAFDEDLGRWLASNMREEVYLISIYSENPQAVVVSDHVVEYTYAASPVLWEIAAVRANPSEIIYRVNRTPGLGRVVVSIFGPALGNDPATLFRRSAVIQVDVLALEFLTNAMPNDHREPEFGVYVFGEAGTPVFSRPVADTEPPDVWAMLQDDAGAESETMVTRSKDSFVLLLPEAILGLRYAFVFPVVELHEKLSASLLQMGLLSLVVVGVFVVASVGLTRPYKERLSRLIAKIGAVKQGDLRNDQPMGGVDEIGLVDGHLSEMVTRLRELLKTVYEEEIELKDAQLTVLESQINPHFLFNTLEHINSIAEVHGDDAVCTITEMLGRMLRYNLDSSSSHWATVEEEFANVRDYLSIYQIRFGDTFSVHLDVDSAAIKTHVPRFILQPLVENSMKHGFADSPQGGELRLSVRVAEDTLRLVVEDNGVGMSKQQEEEFHTFMRLAVSDRHLHPKRGERIGLKNVFMRLLLTHGETFKMSIETRAGGGTRIALDTPVRTPETRHVQAAHRR